MEQAKKFYLSTNGCPRRGLDTSRLARYVELNKCKITDNAEEADYILFISCCFRKCKEDECVKSIEEFKKLKGELIVLGCLPEINLPILKKLFGGKYLSTKEIDKIDDFFQDFKIKFKDIPDTHIFKSHPKSIATDKKFAYLRISFGCFQKCAYCAINRAVGKFKSKPLEQCKKEYKMLLDKGYRHIIFHAENVGAYGLDIGRSFGELLEELDKIDSGLNIKWEIKELHPVWLVKYSEELKKLIRSDKLALLQCSLQSGSDRILSLMSRYESIENVKNILIEFKKINPQLKLTTQLIIGFPSETEDDFNATLDLIKEIKFSGVSLFPYYDAPHTPASKMRGKINEEVITSRMNKARDLLVKEKVMSL